MMIALVLLVERTKLGKAMRATSYDREAAAMMGIDVDRVIASTFFIGWLPPARPACSSGSSSSRSTTSWASRTA